MAPLISANATEIPQYLFKCTGDPNNRRCYLMRFFQNDDEPINILHFFSRCTYWWCSPNSEEQEWDRDRDRDNRLGNSDTFTSPYMPMTTTIKPPKGRNEHDEILQFVAFKILLPIVMVLIAICFVLGVILIVKSYMMAPLKQNLATAIRRRRRFGHAPENNYIPPAEMRASHRMSNISDRKSLPPPEVLIAARMRASQLLAAQNLNSASNSA